jgi:hypothetical protein
MGVNQLAFAMQSQLQSNWCWAAVSASVAQFFGSASPSGAAWQQCSVANAELGQTTCCTNGTTSACNQDWKLDLALTRVGHLAGPVVVGPVAFTDVEGEVDGGRPVGVRIGWYGGGGHFVVISGYDDTNGGQQIDIEDPYYGPSTYDYNTFQSGYQSGAGQWTHTYPIA